MLGSLEFDIFDDIWVPNFIQSEKMDSVVPGVDTDFAMATVDKIIKMTYPLSSLLDAMRDALPAFGFLETSILPSTIRVAVVAIRAITSRTIVHTRILKAIPNAVDQNAVVLHSASGMNAPNPSEKR